jgi:hypothetical protein
MHAPTDDAQEDVEREVVDLERELGHTHAVSEIEEPCRQALTTNRAADAAEGHRAERLGGERAHTGAGPVAPALEDEPVVEEVVNRKSRATAEEHHRLRR